MTPLDPGRCLSDVVPVSAKRVAVKTAREFERRLRRLRNPFVDGERRCLVHVAHHKVGTVWFRNVLSAVAREYGLSFATVRADGRPLAEVVLYLHRGVFRRNRPSVPFRGSHLVRDPRDVVVSAYFYHLWSGEKWLHAPRQRFGGKSYQEYLRSVTREEGLATEMVRTLEGDLRSMAAWDYTQPEFLELRYEDLIEDERAGFARIFRHYGFHDRAIESAVEIAARYSFRHVAGRPVGVVLERQHLRSGKPSQWREVFTQAHHELFRELTGDMLERLGYEPAVSSSGNLRKG